MSTETLLPLAEAMPSGHAPSTAVSPAADTPTLATSLQERRLRAARELEARIRQLEQETLRLAAALETARQRARGHLGELQQRSTSLTTEVLRLGARLARQGRDQEGQLRQLDQRLCQQLRELEAALQPLAEALRAQAQQLDDLQARHETLMRLHEHLDRIVSRQGRGLDIVAAEFGQRVELLRVSLEGMQSLFRDQQQSQMRIAVEQEGLSTFTQALQARVDASLAEGREHREQTRRRLQVFASMLAALALASLGLIAWFQLHPVTLPAAARQQLATLDNRLELQEGNQARLLVALGQNAQAQADLGRELQRLRRENERLRQDARRQRGRLARMAARMAAIAPPPREFRGAAAGPAPAHAVAPDAAPTSSHETIPLPAALPGSRQDY